MTNFADISHHQANVNLAAYKAAGHDRVVLKATEGTGFVDPMFKTRWQEAGRLGLARVAYHFQRAKFNGAKEFDFFFNTVGQLGPRDRLCLDYEDPETPGRALAGAKEFVGRAMERGVTNGIIYTYRDYGDRTGLRPELFPAGWRNLWIASYSAIPDNQVRLPAGWTSDVARQFTDKANVAGIGSTDYSRLHRDWLDSNAPIVIKDWFDMATLEDLKTAVRSVLNEGTGEGQPNWAASEKAQLATEQTLYNEVQKLKGALSALSGDVDGVANAVVNAVVAAVPTGSVLDPTTLASVVSRAVADELSKRLAVAA